MSVIELATMRAKEGSGDDLAAAYPKALHLVTDVAEGCLNASVMRCIERPEEFILRIEWTSVEAHENFRASPEIDTFRAAVSEHIGEAVGYAHYEVL